MTTIGDKNWEELRQLTAKKVEWKTVIILGLTLNDGQSCKAGTREFTNNHSFDPTKNITKVEVIIHKSELFNCQTNFYHHEERLVAVGRSDDYANKFGARKEIFNIADDEQLIGCELNHCTDCFRGVTWLKMKIIK